MTAPATEPASESVEESLDDKIARLRKELEDAEIDQAGAELMKPVGNFMDWAPEFWDENTKEKPLEEIRAAAVFCKDAWAKFEAWRDAARTATRETTERRPYLALSPIAATVSFRAAFQKRPSGSGSTYRSGNGWKWRLQIAGNMKRGRTWPTREEAEAELALAVADPAFVPVRPDYKRLSPTSKHHCSRCGAGDHKVNRCPDPPPQGQEDPIAGSTTPGKAESRARIDAAVAEARAGRDRVCSSCQRPGHNARTCEGRRPTDSDVTPGHGPPSEVTRDELIKSGVDMATKIAARHTRKSSTRAGMAEDLRSAALEGLVKAADAFDSSRGVPFLAYASRRVNGEVLDFLRDHDHMSRDYREMAKRGEIEPAPAPVSLDQMVDEVGFGDRAPDHAAVDSLDEVERSQVLASLESAATQISARLRTVLRLRYSDDRTLDSIGGELGVTESRACQLLAEAHAAVRAAVSKRIGLAVAVEEPAAVPSQPPSPRLAVAPDAPSNPDYIHPGRGWGPVDANGIATHHLCNGSGKIRIKGESRKCYPCVGTGRRECIRKTPSESAA